LGGEFGQGDFVLHQIGIFPVGILLGGFFPGGIREGLYRGLMCCVVGYRSWSDTTWKTWCVSVSRLTALADLTRKASPSSSVLYYHDYVLSTICHCFLCYNWHSRIQTSRCIM